MYTTNIMCAYVCMYVCMYIYIYIYIDSSIYLLIYTSAGLQSRRTRKRAASHPLIISWIYTLHPIIVHD